jgi:hypothetical protein
VQRNELRSSSLGFSTIQKEIRFHIGRGFKKMNKITRFYLPSPEVSAAIDINVGPFIIQPSHYNNISKEKRMFISSQTYQVGI